MFKDNLSVESHLKEMTVEVLNMRQISRHSHGCNTASLAVVSTEFAASSSCPVAQANQLCCQPVTPDAVTQVGLVSARRKGSPSDEDRMGFLEVLLEI